MPFVNFVKSVLHLTIILLFFSPILLFPLNLTTVTHSIMACQIPLSGASSLFRTPSLAPWYPVLNGLTTFLLSCTDFTGFQLTNEFIIKSVLSPIRPCKIDHHPIFLSSLHLTSLPDLYARPISIFYLHLFLDPQPVGVLSPLLLPLSGTHSLLM